MKVEVYCASRSIWAAVYAILKDVLGCWSMDDINDFARDDFTFLKSCEIDTLFVKCYDRRIPFYSTANYIFMDELCPQSVKAALKVANPLTVPIVFNSKEEFRELWRKSVEKILG